MSTDSQYADFRDVDAAMQLAGQQYHDNRAAIDDLTARVGEVEVATGPQPVTDTDYTVFLPAE